MLYLEVYKDAKDEWRWNIRAKNGNIMADSGEGYTRRGNCIKAVNRIIKENKFDLIL